ncbi:hypothetical protein Tco_1029945 [Tanacetum coccineum]|uniref:Uncharacterized protein n=1 Tax=Tanacetum coccineum TaxID=301880 RepID=A0ABQ5G4Z7_9ASTR
MKKLRPMINEASVDPTRVVRENKERGRKESLMSAKEAYHKGLESRSVLPKPIVKSGIHRWRRRSLSRFGYEEISSVIWIEDVSSLLPLQARHLPKQDKVNLHNAVSLWTRNIVIRKHVEDLQLGIESYQTKLNLEQPNWDASDFPFKEYYTIVFKPRAVIYRDINDNRKMMRIDEVHTFSDGTLTRIKEKLDFIVKDFKLFKFNKGMENRK